MTLKLTKPPYGDTKISAEKSQQEITELLKKYGVSQVAWAVDYDSMKVQLQFVIEYEKPEDSSIHKIAILVRPPMFAAKRRTFNTKTGHYETLTLPNWAQSMRLLYYWIKAKLEAVSYGLNSVEKEFLSDIVTRLPDGSQKTVWELIEEQAKEERFMLEAPASFRGDAK